MFSFNKLAITSLVLLLELMETSTDLCPGPGTKGVWLNFKVVQTDNADSVIRDILYKERVLTKERCNLHCSTVTSPNICFGITHCDHFNEDECTVYMYEGKKPQFNPSKHFLALDHQKCTYFSNLCEPPPTSPRPTTTSTVWTTLTETTEVQTTEWTKNDTELWTDPAEPEPTMKIHERGLGNTVLYLLIGAGTGLLVGLILYVFCTKKKTFSIGNGMNPAVVTAASSVAGKKGKKDKKTSSDSEHKKTSSVAGGKSKSLMGNKSKSVLGFKGRKSKSSVAGKKVKASTGSLKGKFSIAGKKFKASTASPSGPKGKTVRSSLAPKKTKMSTF